MNKDDILEVAARWHSRQSADDMDLQAFQAWLDADPRHGDAFDDIALLDEAIDHHRETLRRLLPEIEPIPVTPRDRRWQRRDIAGGIAAVAACALLVVVVTRNPTPSPVPRAIPPQRLATCGSPLRGSRWRPAAASTRRTAILPGRHSPAVPYSR